MKTYKLTPDEMNHLKKSTFPERLTFFRLKAQEISSTPEKFSVQGISDYLHVSCQTIFNIEKSLVGISFDNVYKLSNLIGFPMESLMDSYYESPKLKPIVLKLSNFKVRSHSFSDDALTKNDYKQISNMTLAEKLTYIRTQKANKYSKKNYNLESLSKRANIPLATYYQVERGVVKNPSFNTICAISFALGVPLYVLCDKDYPTPSRIKFKKEETNV